MKKNLISVIILALCVVNLVLNALMVFVFVPSIKRTDNLVSEIAAILNLELEKKDGEETASVDIGDVQIYNCSETMTIGLKTDGTGENHYAVVDLAISMNGSAEDYETVSTKLADTESWIYDVSRGVIQEYTYTEVNDPDIQTLIKQEIVKGLQEEYQTDCIYDVKFSSFITQ